MSVRSCRDNQFVRLRKLIPDDWAWLRRTRMAGPSCSASMQNPPKPFPCDWMNCNCRLFAKCGGLCFENRNWCGFSDRWGYCTAKVADWAAEADSAGCLARYNAGVRELQGWWLTWPHRLHNFVTNGSLPGGPSRRCPVGCPRQQGSGLPGAGLRIWKHFKENYFITTTIIYYYYYNYFMKTLLLRL